MKLDDLRLEHVERILEIWESFGGCLPSYAKPGEIYADLEAVRLGVRDRDLVNDGFRIGSRFTGHSKLVLEVRHDGSLEVYFNPNLDVGSPCEARVEPEARKASEDFGNAVREYFESLGPLRKF